MDAIGPYEVLHTANRLRQRSGIGDLCEVLTIGEPCAVFGGLGVAPALRVAEAGSLDVLIVPGAIDIEAASPDADLRTLAAAMPDDGVLASVCTGSFFLHRNGLADDVELTTHWEHAALLAAAGATVRDDVRWVDAGHVVSSGGISSGIAMALHLVERFGGRELAEATARQIDYVWSEAR